MKENSNTNQKAFWIVGIAIIVFLVLVLGSVIGLKITRDGINSILGNNNIGNNSGSGANPGYVVLEDGTMQNTNANIRDTEIVVDGRKFSNFSIEEKEGTSTIKVDIENTTDEDLGVATFEIKLYDSEDNLITEYSMLTTEQEAKAKTTALTSLVKSCINTARIEVNLISAE